MRSDGTHVVRVLDVHYGDLADHLGDLVSVHGSDGACSYASPASRDLLGYEPHELVGDSLYDHLHPDDVTRVGVAHRSALDGAPYTVSYRLRRKDGDYVWVETTTRTVARHRAEEVTEILCCTRALENRAGVDEPPPSESSDRFERIEEVLAEEAIGPVFQPIIELETGRVIAFEALSRFPGDPAHTPDRWFADAWEAGLGVPLELLAVRKAASALSRIPDGLNLCVNASPPTAVADGFLRCFGGSAARITVELTEHLQIDDYPGFGTRLQPLRSAGGTVAIDDFGAGYASLRHILMVSPEWIKLDISLIERIDENPVAYALASSVASFAREVGVNVIAEGVETEDEAEALADIGLRYGQGFHFGMPASLDDALAAA
jgi:PAS domain S-box-containing protein